MFSAPASASVFSISLVNNRFTHLYMLGYQSGKVTRKLTCCSVQVNCQAPLVANERDHLGRDQTRQIHQPTLAKITDCADIVGRDDILLGSVLAATQRAVSTISVWMIATSFAYAWAPTTRNPSHTNTMLNRPTLVQDESQAGCRGKILYRWIDPTRPTRKYTGIAGIR